MGWQDRRYNSQVNYGGNPFTHPLLKILFGSVYLGTLFRTRIRIHATFLWYIGLTVAFAGPDWRNAAISVTALFAIVFLHEFGHIFACRSVGGDADEIMMWFLGGLAFTNGPRRPWARFVTVAGGPLVNVIIGLILGSIIILGYHVSLPLNPLVTYLPSMLSELYKNHPENWYALFNSRLGTWLFWIFMTNYSILFFNLIPMFPLDGGQLLQAILWKPLGYVRSMKIACYLGMIMAVIVGLFGLRFSLFLTGIAVFAFMGSLQQLRITQMAGAEEEERDQYDLSAAWENPDHPKSRRKKLKKGIVRSAQKKARRDQAEQAKIDTILSKVKQKGLHSLTWFEKRTLKKATERQRQQDLAERH